MKNATHILATLAAFVIAGCVGAIEPPPQGGNGDGDGDGDGDISVDAGTPDIPGSNDSTPMALFEQNVFPILQANCGSAGCHDSAGTDPKFVANQRSGSYDQFMIYKTQLIPNLATTDKLLINGGGNHKGATFTTSDLTAIETWLNAEKSDGGGGGTVSPLSIWSGCMEFADWQAADVADRWADKNARGQGNCDACHNLGADGFMASNDDRRVFDNVAGSASFMQSYFTLNVAIDGVIINRERLERVGNQEAPHGNHGSFNLNGNAMAALQQFYDLTKARLDAGNCKQPRF